MVTAGWTLSSHFWLCLIVLCTIPRFDVTHSNMYVERNGTWDQIGCRQTMVQDLCSRSCACPESWHVESSCTLEVKYSVINSLTINLFFFLTCLLLLFKATCWATFPRQISSSLCCILLVFILSSISCRYFSPISFMILIFNAAAVKWQTRVKTTRKSCNNSGSNNGYYMNSVWRCSFYCCTLFTDL